MLHLERWGSHDLDILLFEFNFWSILMTGYEPFFSEHEAWGDLTKVKWYHIHHLWLIRTKMIEHGLDWPMVINCCYEEAGHASKSYHSRDNSSVATDFHFDTESSINTQKALLLRAINELGLADRMGIGTYPFWNTPGFHLDSRGSRVRWDCNNAGEYIFE